MPTETDEREPGRIVLCASMKDFWRFSDIGPNARRWPDVCPAWEYAHIDPIHSGRWTVIRTDFWQYDERIIERLKLLQHRGIVVGDPSGLLGGSKDGFMYVGKVEPKPQFRRTESRRPKSDSSGKPAGVARRNWGSFN